MTHTTSGLPVEKRTTFERLPTATLVYHVTLESESPVFQDSRYLDSNTIYGEVKSPRLFIAQNVLK